MRDRRRAHRKTSGTWAAGILAVGLLTLGACVVPPPPPPPTTGSIQGTVVSTATGLGQLGVLVEVLLASDQSLVASTATAADGTYAVAGLAPGTYRVRFSGADFITELWNDAADFASADDLTVIAGGTTIADASLSPTTEIGGTVTADSDGAPLSGVVVEALRSTDQAVIASTATLGDGTYQLAGLPEGTYRVRFDGTAGGHGTEYWDDAATFFGATDVVTTAATDPHAGHDAALGAPSSDCNPANLVPGANLNGLDLSYCDMHGLDLSNATFASTDLTGADMHDATVRGAIFLSVSSQFDFTCACALPVYENLAITDGLNVAGADLTDAMFVQAQMAAFNQDWRGTDFTGTETHGGDPPLGWNWSSYSLGFNTFGGVTPTFAGYDFVARGTLLTDAVFTNQEFYAANLTGIDASRISCMYCSFDAHTYTDGGGALHVVGPPNLANTNLTDANLRESTFKYANLNGANLTGDDLTITTMANTNLVNADLTNADLVGSTTDYADFTGADLTGADVTNVDFKHAILTNATITSLDITGAKFFQTSGFPAAQLPTTDPDWTNASFPGVGDTFLGFDFTTSGLTITGTTFGSGNFTGSKFDGLNLTGTHLQVTLTNSTFIGATLTNATFINAITGVNFTNATGMTKNIFQSVVGNLTDVNFTGTGLNFTGVSFSPYHNLLRTNFTGVTLTNANLTGRNMTGDVLTNAVLSGANLTNANMSGATGGGIGASTATYSNTRCPDDVVTNGTTVLTCVGHGLNA